MKKKHVFTFRLLLKIVCIGGIAILGGFLLMEELMLMIK